MKLFIFFTLLLFNTKSFAQDIPEEKQTVTKLERIVSSVFYATRETTTSISVKTIFYATTSQGEDIQQAISEIKCIREEDGRIKITYSLQERSPDFGEMTPVITSNPIYTIGQIGPSCKEFENRLHKQQQGSSQIQ